MEQYCTDPNREQARNHVVFEYSNRSSICLQVPMQLIKTHEHRNGSDRHQHNQLPGTILFVYIGSFGKLAVRQNRHGSASSHGNEIVGNDSRDHAEYSQSPAHSQRNGRFAIRFEPVKCVQPKIGQTKAELKKDRKRGIFSMFTASITFKNEIFRNPTSKRF